MKWYKRSLCIRKSKRKRGKEPVALFLLPSFAGVLIFVLIPFLDMVRRSFYTAETGVFCGITNYERIF